MWLAKKLNYVQYIQYIVSDDTRVGAVVTSRYFATF